MAKAPKDKARDALRAKMRSKAALLTGRQRKDLAMVKAREIAARGGCSDFKHVVSVIAREDVDAADTLSIWAGGNDRDAIDMICSKWSRSQKR